MCSEKFTKMAGYLERRGKLSIMGRWKKWWCVLEGQLLLYYKSRIDYTNLSPCCGSLNMALVKNVQPHIGYQIHIVTHTQLIIMRTKNKEKQQQWFHALVGVLPQNSYLSPLFYFSTISTDYKRKSDRKKKKSKYKYFPQKQLIQSIDTSTCTELYKQSELPNESLNFTSTSSFETRILTNIRNSSASECTEMRAENTNISRLIECSIRQNKLTHSSIKYSSDINIRRYSSYHSINNGSLQNDATITRRSISCECIFRDYRITSIERYEFLRRPSIQSEEAVKDESQNPNESNEIELFKESNIYRRLKNDSKKNGTLSRRSFSFLKKMFKKKTEYFSEQPVVELAESKEKTDEERAPSEISLPKRESPILDFQEQSSIQTENNNESAQNKIEELTIYNHFEKKTTNTNSDIEIVSESSSADENIIPDSLLVDEKLPDLPVKNGNRLSNICHDYDKHLDYNNKDNFENEICTEELVSIGTCMNVELDSLLLQLTALNNNECDKSQKSVEFNNNTIEDPDYDIPRPHTSLISETESEASMQGKNSVDQLSDSISNQKRRDSLSMDMAPDSLEMPWLLDNATYNINYWTTKREFNLLLENDSGSEYDYHDSLNSNNKFYT